jgi:hypothetical protein
MKDRDGKKWQVAPSLSKEGYPTCIFEIACAPLQKSPEKPRGANCQCDLNCRCVCAKKLDTPYRMTEEGRGS